MRQRAIPVVSISHLAILEDIILGPLHTTSPWLESGASLIFVPVTRLGEKKK